MKDLQKLKTDTLLYPERAKEIKITDTLSLNSANSFLVSVKRMRMEINNAFDPIIKKAHEAHREAIETKKRFDKPLQAAEMIVKPQVAAYFGELARLRKEAEEAARKELEERNRKEEEQIEAAIKSEEAGDTEKADEILNNEIPKVVPMEDTPIPKLKGTSIRQIWKWKLINFDKVPREYLIVNANAIMASIRENKGKTDIPGIRVYPIDIVSTRG